MPILVTIGVICALAYVVEAAIGSWSAVHIERTLGASPAIGGWGPGIVGLSMVAGRLAWHRWAGRVDALVSLAAGALASTIGILIAATADGAGIAIAGFGIAGLGVSVVGPIVYGFAGREAGDANRGRGISIVTTIGYLGLLSGPALVGVIAEQSSLRTALLWMMPFGVACAALSLVVARLRRA